MGKTNQKPLPPPKRVTVTLTPRLVWEILHEQHERRMAGENVNLAMVVLDRLESSYGVGGSQ